MAPKEHGETNEVQDSLENLFLRLADPLYRYALHLLRHAQDAEEAIQNVFLKMLRRNDRSIPKEAYVFASVRNQCIDMQRSAKRKSGGKVPVELIDARGVDPLTRKMVQDSLQELPEEQREVIILKFFCQLTFSEIAIVLGVNHNTVAGRYRYGINRLQELWSKGAESGKS
jgi:RNA polymerase sigma-70 factor (ECF subfamily)